MTPSAQPTAATGSELSFEGQVVLVTGAGGGLGRAYALELARRGAKVVVNDLGVSKEGVGAAAAPAQAVVAEILAAGGDAIANADSVATQAGGEALVNAALDRWGRLDALISNAGILRDRSFAKLDFDDLEAVLDVHLRGGGFFVPRPAFAAMKAQGGGRIVLTTSASGLFGNFGQTGYGAAKLGLVGLMRSLALEGVRDNIKVNAIAPIAATRLSSSSNEAADQAKAPSKVAALATLLVHRDCPSTGQVFVAGAGWFSRAFIGLGPGWTAPGDPTPESVLANWSSIVEPGGFSEPLSVADIRTLINS